MSFEFNANDVFEMAEQIERNGAKFYREAAAGLADAASKEFLMRLADMEDNHERTFAAMKADLSGQETAQTAFDPENEAVLYLRALADTRVFFKKEIDTTSMLDILKSAITAEKDSIVFYLGMKDMVSQNQGKQKIDDIIKEEMGHITMLSKELVALKKS